MRRRRQRQSGNIALYLVVLLALTFAVIPVALHFMQKRHDVLPLDIATVFPLDKPIVPGEIYATVLMTIIKHELESPAGWRPNDFFLWSPHVLADNNSNRQLGIILALRESTRIFKDHLTKVSSTEFDPNLVEADTLLRNDAEKFWFPSAEGRFKEAVVALQRYLDGLRATPPRSKVLARRNVELIRLFQSWGDMLGDAHANLYKDHEADGSAVRPWHTDNYFYHAQGVAHVMHYLALALKREYAEDLINRQTVAELLDDVATTLGTAALLKPLVVLDGGPDSVTANHRRNMDVYIAEARQKMYSIREELEK
jgi:hypothetical protein